MIALRDATLVRRGRCLVGPLSLRLEPGTTAVVVGPNGAGKSTLLRLMSGEFSPSAGEATLDGTPLRLFRPGALASRRAVLAQSTDGGLAFTVRELAGLGLRMLRMRLSRARQDQLVEEALATIGLLALAARPVASLSGGERQRAHFARVLVQLHAGRLAHGPGALLLDEPIAAQDLAHQLRILDVARLHAAAGGAVAMVLHDLNWAARAADRLLVLHHGRLYADGSPRAVITRPMLADVFGVDLCPGALPNASTPFVLPQLMASAARAKCE